MASNFQGFGGEIKSSFVESTFRSFRSFTSLKILQHILRILTNQTSENPMNSVHRKPYLFDNSTFGCCIVDPSKIPISISPGMSKRAIKDIVRELHVVSFLADACHSCHVHAGRCLQLTRSSFLDACLLNLVRICP